VHKPIQDFYRARIAEFYDLTFKATFDLLTKGMGESEMRQVWRDEYRRRHEDGSLERVPMWEAAHWRAFNDAVRAWKRRRRAVAIIAERHPSPLPPLVDADAQRRAAEAGEMLRRLLGYQAEQWGMG
jgi:hypothetical protein